MWIDTSVIIFALMGCLKRLLRSSFWPDSICFSLIMLSHLHNKVLRLSSSRLCSLIRAPRTLRVDVISLSQTPPWCQALAGLKNHLMLFCSKASWIFSLISAVNHDTKLPFTSYEIGTIVGANLLTWPLRLMKRVTHIEQHVRAVILKYHTL